MTRAKATINFEIAFAPTITGYSKIRSINSMAVVVAI